MLAIVPLVVGFVACGDTAKSGFSIQDEEGDASPEHLDIVGGSIAFGEDETVVDIVVAASLPRSVEGTVGWQVGLFVPGPRQYMINVHLQGERWSAEVGRSPAADEPPISARAIDIDRPSGRKLTVVVPATLMQIRELDRIVFQVTSSDDDGIVDTAEVRADF